MVGRFPIAMQTQVSTMRWLDDDELVRMCYYQKQRYSKHGVAVCVCNEPTAAMRWSDAPA